MNKAPKTIEEAYAELDKIFEQEPRAKAEFAAVAKKEDMVQFHHTLGQWMRNNWGLWRNSKLAQLLETKKIMHPDNMSGALLEGYWCYRHNVSYEYKGSGCPI